MQLQDIRLGQELTWLHEQRGGYGFTVPVDASVVKIGEKRVQIKVSKASGECVLRWVSPCKLKVRQIKKAV